MSSWWGNPGDAFYVGNQTAIGNTEFIKSTENQPEQRQM